MSCLFYQQADVLPFVKTCVVHNDYTVHRQHRNKLLLAPGMKNISIDRILEQGECNEAGSQQAADGICASFCVPLMYRVTGLSPERISIRPWHILLKSAFVQIDNGPSICGILFNLCTKEATFVFISFGVVKSFFSCSHPYASRHHRLSVS